ncbi:MULTISPECIES: hypothetical protein [unclassified Mesorhizobium]|uniref:hypothetical protein n=1 Tax=unclassified Mesorhizobium TaxID=325217 RepID=UPI001FEF5EFD|nr:MULTISPECIES: hypothetical protein [unclassified Mesorhizobium]
MSIFDVIEADLLRGADSALVLLSDQCDHPIQTEFFECMPQNRLPEFGAKPATGHMLEKAKAVFDIVRALEAPQARAAGELGLIPRPLHEHREEAEAVLLPATHIELDFFLRILARWSLSGKQRLHDKRIGVEAVDDFKVRHRYGTHQKPRRLKNTHQSPPEHRVTIFEKSVRAQ